MEVSQYFDIKNDTNDKILIEKTKHKLMAVVPDKIPEGQGLSSLYCCVPGSQNPDYKKPFDIGCQFLCMCYQNNDINLKNYNKQFNDEGSAFILKPEHLRANLKKIQKPTPQTITKSFAERTVKDSSGAYSFKI